MLRRCPKCKEVKSADCFGKNSRNTHGLSTYCLNCDRARRRDYYKKHPNKVVDSNTKWVNKNLERVSRNKARWQKKNSSKARVNAREWAKNNPELTKAYKHKSRGVLFPPGVDEKSLKESQGNRCANLRCRVVFSDLHKAQIHVDHDHAKPGEVNVRGILCYRCNLLLGIALEDIDRLIGAAEYLRSHGK